MTPEVFLIVVGLYSWLTINAFRPLYWPGWAAVATFFAGWLTAELAVQTMVVHTLVTTGFIAFGGLAQWPGWIAVGLTGVNLWGLSKLVRRSARTLDEVREALTQGLGPDFEALAHHELREQFGEPLRLRRVLQVFPIRGRNLVRHIDIPYGDQKRQNLDVYTPKGSVEGAPVLVYIHGGGWVIGNKTFQGLTTISHLVPRGWICVSINYRLSPRATFPDHIIDVKRALAWVRQHIHEYGGDPGFIAVAGGSAGAHLCTLAALTPNDPELQPGFEEVDTRVDACVAYYGIYDFTDDANHIRHGGFRDLLRFVVMKAPLKSARDRYEAASPIHRIGKDAPPLLLVHGTNDSLAPVAGARDFVQRFREATDTPIAHIELHGAQHAFEVFPSIRSEHVVRGVEQFLAWAHGYAAKQRPASDVAPEGHDGEASKQQPAAEQGSSAEQQAAG